jgi:hypothetical protein
LSARPKKDADRRVGRAVDQLDAAAERARAQIDGTRDQDLGDPVAGLIAGARDRRAKRSKANDPLITTGAAPLEVDVALPH